MPNIKGMFGFTVHKYFLREIMDLNSLTINLFSFFGILALIIFLFLNLKESSSDVNAENFIDGIFSERFFENIPLTGLEYSKLLTL